jgi:signal peptidase I
MSKSKRHSLTRPSNSSDESSTADHRGQQSSAPDEPLVERHLNYQPVGVDRWFRNAGVRESVESIVIAVILAMLFRYFEAEAFIIPTGSMAPSLRGLHKDITCAECGYEYAAGASSENTFRAARDLVADTYCPICGYGQRILANRPDHRSFKGDRILVNKFIYNFADVARWDAIVFKYPNNGKQNFIKRAVGLPKESIVFHYGDVWAAERDDAGNPGEFRIADKPPRKLLAMLQIVDDTNYIAQQMKRADWPSRWNEWNAAPGAALWQIDTSAEHPVFTSSGETTSQGRPAWLRYRHLVPRHDDWDQLTAGTLPSRITSSLGGLITDHYSYNDVRLQDRGYDISATGLHWVGDLSVWAEVDAAVNTGSIFLDLVEGGTHFTCTLDLAAGTATFTTSNPEVRFVTADGDVVAAPRGEFSTNSRAAYELQFANADNRLYLWVNGSHVAFDADRYHRSQPVVPAWSSDDAGDAEPAGIAAQGVALTVNRLKIFRDVYYTSSGPYDDLSTPANETAETERRATEWRQRSDSAALAASRAVKRAADGISIHSEYDPATVNALLGTRYGLAVDPRDIREVLDEPRRWGTPEAAALFQARLPTRFDLQEGQLFPAGDNSPESSDARIWDGPHYVDQSYLLGKAIFVYWPHMKPWRIPLPNFEQMRFIR